MSNFLNSAARICSLILFVLLIFGPPLVVVGGVITIVVGSTVWWVFVMGVLTALFTGGSWVWRFVDLK